MPDQPTLETDRLRIRPFHANLSDVDAMFEVLSDPISMRFYPKPFDRDRTRAWVERWLDADRLISLIRPENVPSWSVARTLGFRPWRATVRHGMGCTVWSVERPSP